MSSKNLRVGFLVFAPMFIMCALIAHRWINVSILGTVTGAVYAALSAEVYAALIREISSEERRLLNLLLVTAVKLSLLAGFVYLLTIVPVDFLWSCLFGFGVIIPAGLWGAKKIRDS